MINPDFCYAAAKREIKEKHYDRAAALLELVLKLESDPAKSGRALFKLGYCRFMLGEYETAVTALQSSSELRPNRVRTLVALGAILHTIGRAAEGRELLQKALAVPPQSPDDHVTAAYLRISFGDHTESWRQAEESRWEAEVSKMGLPNFPANRRWDGRALTDEPLYVITEGGFGDAFLFGRFIPLIAERVRRIIIAAPSALKPVLEGLPGVETVVTDMTTVSAALRAEPSTAWFTSFWSLPSFLDMSPELVASQVPYIRPPASGHLLPDSAGKLRVGIVWAGNPDTPHDHDRSCHTPELFRPLFELEGTEWYSLQMGEKAEAAARSLPISPMPPVRDFGDTAFLISQLDLVISVDSAVANLAGGLGKKVWILIPTIPEFRWPIEGSSSAWYPTGRLFRRSRTTDWAGVIEELRVALVEMLSSR